MEVVNIPARTERSVGGCSEAQAKCLWTRLAQRYLEQFSQGITKELKETIRCV